MQIKEGDQGMPSPLICVILHIVHKGSFNTSVFTKGDNSKGVAGGGGGVLGCP